MAYKQGFSRKNIVRVGITKLRLGRKDCLILLIVVALWLNFCNNCNRSWLSIALAFIGSIGNYSEIIGL